MEHANKQQRVFYGGLCLSGGPQAPNRTVCPNPEVDQNVFPLYLRWRDLRCRENCLGYAEIVGRLNRFKVSQQFKFSLSKFGMSPFQRNLG